MYNSKNDSKFNEYDIVYSKDDNTKLSTFFEHTLWKPTIESLGSQNYYKINTKLKRINNKRTKISLKKFLNKYFKN